MLKRFLEILRCPATGSRLTLEIDSEEAGRIKEGSLVALANQKIRYPIKQFIPRFVPVDNYASSFGFQWLKHPDTQYDSVSGVNTSEQRFFAETKWPRNLNSQIILEAGCGAGIFTEYAVSTGAMVVSFDYSLAVEASYKRNGAASDLLILQADIFNMPFEDELFDRIFCFGVLQHTPSPKRAFDQLVRVLRPNGYIAVDVYRFSLPQLTKYLVRPITRQIAPEILYPLCRAYVTFLWPLACMIRRIPKYGPYLNWLLLVADYSAWYRLEEAQLKQWAILNTFDMLSPRYDKPQTLQRVANWFMRNALTSVEVVKGYNGIEGRGRKAARVN